MRRLAKLLHATKGVEKAAELFKVDNFYQLEDAIKYICQPDSSSDKPVKAGLRIAIGTLVRIATKVLSADYIINRQAERVKEVEQFEKVFNLNYSKNFSVAEYCLKENRQRDNRKPNALPEEADIEKLRKYLVDEIAKTATMLGEAMSKRHYIHLRKIVLTRLTLLNGRRGSEPGRILLQDFMERNSWSENPSKWFRPKALGQNLRCVCYG